MIEFIRWMLRRDRAQSGAPSIRPNELRRDVVRADRLRREAHQPRRAADSASVIAEERREDRAPTAGSPPPQVRPPHPSVAALQSRSKLREALVLKEILDPPRSLREPRRDA